MRHSYLLVLAVGCGFKATESAPDAQAPGLLSGTWSFPGAAELAAPGHVAVDMTIDARGALTPVAYTYGGLIAHGQASTKVWAHGQVGWDALDPALAAGAGLWRGDDIDVSTGLDYLGVPARPPKVTLWFEGEVWLEAGSNERFTLHANDVAFIDIAPPGTTQYAPPIESDATVDVATPVTGWYPIRIGYADGDGTGELAFTHTDGAGPAIPWTRDRLRARASDVSGTLRTVFGHQILGGGFGPAQVPVSYLESADLLSAADFDIAPQFVGQDDWSARYAGQFYAAEPGAYTLQVVSDDGNRVRLGSMVKQDRWSRDTGVGGNPAMTSVTATLPAGWNDLAIDYNEVTGTRAMHAEIQGPEFASPVAVPRARLRPVEAADDRLATGGDDSEHDIPNDGGASKPGTATVHFTGFTGETVSSIDVTFGGVSDHWNQIRADLEVPPGGAAFRRQIHDHDSHDFGGPHTYQVTVPAGSGDLAPLLGGPSTGDFKLHVYDDAGGGNKSTLQSAKITLHTTGGPDRIARIASWASPVLDAQTAVRAIDGITWEQRLATDSRVEVHVRSCQQAGCSDDPAWSSPVTMAAAVAVEPGRYLQLRVDMTSNGALEPELRALAVTYRRDP